MFNNLNERMVTVVKNKIAQCYDEIMIKSLDLGIDIDDFMQKL